MNFQETLHFIKKKSDQVREACFDLGGVSKVTNQYLFKNKLSELIPEFETASAISIFNALKKLGFLTILTPQSGSDYLHDIYVFFPENHNIFTIANVFANNFYYSHHTALYLNQLTLNQSNTLYIKNNTKKADVDRERGNFNQKRIDITFSKPMRKSNVINYLSWSGKNYEIVMLEGLHIGEYGLKKLEMSADFHSSIQYSDIEKTLIDIVVRPAYSGGMNTVVEAFSIARDSVSVTKMAHYLNLLNMNYPYERNIALFMKKAGYDATMINSFLSKISLKEVDYIFYLDYQMINKQLDEELKIYYPSNLLDNR